MKILFFILLSFTASAQFGPLILSTKNPGTTPTPIPPDPPPVGDIYVQKTGSSDANPCTSASPCLTIQRGINSATPGKTIIVGPGTYRETIVPPISGTAGNPITIVLDAAAVISGLEDATGGWSVHSGNIYKKTIALPVTGYNSTLTSNTSLMANQIFKDGEMMFEARYPNISTVDELWDISKQKFITSANFQPNYLIDPALAGLGLAGGTIITNGWFVVSSSTINSQSGNQINYNNIWDNTSAGIKVRRSYYVTNKLSLLDAEKEWHYEGGVLYFRQPGGGSPTGVTYKARNWGFDLRNRSYITIQGGTFFGCEVLTGNDNTSNIIVDGVTSLYANHSVRHDVQIWQGYGMSKQMGLKMCGSDNVVQNSKFEYTASNVVWAGANCRVENNHFSHICYDASMGSPVSLWGVRTNGQKILHNTAHTYSRGFLDFGYDYFADNAPEVDNHGHQNVELAYNDVSDFNKLNCDGSGLSYAFGDMVLNGGRIHHNWTHDTGLLNPNQKDGIQVGGQGYFDQATGGVVIDHNISWNAGNSDYYHETATPWVPAGRINWLYNNAMATTSLTGPGNPPHSTVTYVTSPLDPMRNNIFRKDIVVNWQAGNIGNNANYLLEGTNPQWVGGSLSTPQVYFQLQAGSPAVDAGVVIPGITDGYIGSAPDIGPYERGGTAWVAGCSGQLCVD